jgi:putative protein-disulfide isomerase
MERMEKDFQPVIYYCYDAYCGWCYGFSETIIKMAEAFKDVLSFEVLSGGMIFNKEPKHIGAIAHYVQGAYQKVEERTGIRFGKDYLWHMFHPDKSDWYPDSTLPGIALCIFKEYFPDKAVYIARDIQYALNYEGRDLTDKEAYRHLVRQYGIPEEDFYIKLASEEYREKAFYEFALVKQLQVTGFPTVFMQAADARFFLLSQGYTEEDQLRTQIEKGLKKLQEEKTP